MAKIPADRSYSEDHEWVLIAPGAEVPSEPVRVGITDVAAEALGELVFAELPEAGAEVKAGEQCGELESTKAVSELISPVSGRVAEVNGAVDDDPSVVNSDPYGDGWLFTVEVSAAPDLLTAAAYAEKNGVEA